MPFLSLHALIVAPILLLRALDMLSMCFMRLCVFMQITRSSPVLFAQGMALAAEEDDIVDDVLLTEEEDDIIEDELDEDIADEDDAEDMLSAKLRGINATAVEAATKRERDFFIGKNGVSKERCRLA